MELSEASKLVGKKRIIEYHQLRKTGRHEFRHVEVLGVDAVGMSVKTVEPVDEDDGTVFIPWGAIHGVIEHWKYSDDE